MDHYHVWCNLKPGASDTEFCRRVDRYLGHLKDEGLIESYLITRRKLGLGPPELGQFHIVLQTRDMAQLETAFQRVATRADPEESFHYAVNSLASDARFALYRDFPDAVRREGEEKF